MLRGSQKQQDRVLMIIGGAVLLCIVLVGVLIAANPFAGRPKDELFISIITPYVGQGVEAGTAVVMHGVKVGEVTNVTNTAEGGVKLATQLQAKPVQGLTDAMDIDFRPINYFGVPGINLLANSGGEALQDGTSINLVPTGNFTLSELLSQLGDVSASSLTPQLIQVMDRATRYTDGLNPLIETAVTVVRAVDAVQTVPTEQLLANLSTSVAAFPAFTDAVVITGTRTHKLDYYPGQTLQPAASSSQKLEFPFLQEVATPNLGDLTREYFHDHFAVTLDLVENGLFAAVGRLLNSHVNDLIPLVSGMKTITDAGPALLRPADIAETLSELRSRVERLYAGNGEQHAVSVRILLDSLPGVAAPLAVVTESTP